MLDLIVAACVAAIVALGLRAGIASTLPVAAFAAGAVVGALTAPLLLSEGQDSSFALAFALPGALIAGALAAALVERRLARLRRPLARIARRPVADAAGGGALGLWIGAAAVWLLGAVVAQSASLRNRVEDSTIIGGLDGLVSPPGRTGGSTGVPLDRFPTFAGPATDIAPVDRRVVRDPDVRRADASIVQIRVLSCGVTYFASGWVAADGVVVTNAHVSAGASAIFVSLRGTGRPLRATPTWFDPRADLSLLRVPALAGVRALPIAPSTPAGAAGATLGFPSGLHAIAAARIGHESSTLRGLLGGEMPPEFHRRMVGRATMTLRGHIEHGSSGSPLVDRDGRVLTTVWGGRDDRDGGFGVPNRFVRSALRHAGPRVGTGPCAVSTE
jgi:S1-C subfamily serine protease